MSNSRKSHEFLAAMGFHKGGLRGARERLYYDLSFLIGTNGNGCLPVVDVSDEPTRTSDEYRAARDKERTLSNIFWELEAYADPGQTGGDGKFLWADLGSYYVGAGKLPYRFQGQNVDQVIADVRGRLQPLLDRLGVAWPKGSRS